MSEQNKIFEGSIPVNGDITPFSHEKITKVNANKWEDTSYPQLMEQHKALKKRLVIVQQMGRDDLSKQISIGIIKLEQLIKQKHDEDNESNGVLL